jgi:NUMOD4 motif
VSERWKPIPDGPGYEASWDGHFRSVDRVTPSGRRMKGQPIATTTSNRGYVLVKYRNARGERVTKTAHTVILETFDKPCPPGMEARHLDDDPRRNVWRPGDTEDESRARGGNLCWGTKQQNREDRKRNTPPAAPPPRPERACVRCGAPFRGNGRRCHPCVVAVGRDAAQRLSRGETLAQAMKALDYPSAEGLHLLAVRYGGYGARRSWWSRSVKPKVVTLRSRLPGSRRSRSVSEGAAARAPKRETPAEGRKSEAGFPQKLGHSGHPVSQVVTQSRTTQRERPSRTTRAVTRRSR